MKRVFRSKSGFVASLFAIALLQACLASPRRENGGAICSRNSWTWVSLESGTTYEDDGESMQYRQGEFLKRRFHQIGDAGAKVLEISAPEGNYRPAACDLVLQFWVDNAPQAVTERTEQAADEQLPEMDENELSGSSRGWSFANGMLTVKDKDKFEAMRFTLKH